MSKDNNMIAENTYTDRELETIHEGISKDIKSMGKQIREGFEGVHSRQDITNGRVNWLEKMVYLGLGALAVLTMSELSSFIGNIFRP